jgi:hypothetical protein
MMTLENNMPSASELAVYETFESVYGRKSTMDELISDIRPFTQQSVLWVSIHELWINRRGTQTKKLLR